MRRSERAEALGTVSLEWQREIILKFLVQRLAGVVDTGILTNILQMAAGWLSGRVWLHGSALKKNSQGYCTSKILYLYLYKES